MFPISIPFPRRYGATIQSYFRYSELRYLLYLTEERINWLDEECDDAITHDWFGNQSDESVTAHEVAGKLKAEFIRMSLNSRIEGRHSPLR